MRWCAWPPTQRRSRRWLPGLPRQPREFLGFTSNYRQFMEDFACVAQPLHRLTERAATFAWTSECQVAFEELRRRLTSALSCRILISAGNLSWTPTPAAQASEGSPAGNTHILVVADYFTRWMEAYAIPNQEATTVARKLSDEFFFRFSPLEQLHSDQERNFESNVISEVCKLLTA